MIFSLSNYWKVFIAILAIICIVGIFLFFQKSKKVEISNIVAERENQDTEERETSEIEMSEKVTNESEVTKILTEDANKNIEKDNEKNNNKEEEKTNESEKEIANNLKIINKRVTWGYSKTSERIIDTIIIHSSYDALGNDPYNLEGLINEYRQYGVAPHYLIDRQGNIYRLVDDKNIAYHAGESEMPDGRTNVNNFSIGIELMNTETDNFTPSQYDALNDLLRYLSRSYEIEYVLGHNQIAPGRKTDPWNMEWDKVKK
jgi:hypothetical protein